MKNQLIKICIVWIFAAMLLLNFIFVPWKYVAPKYNSSRNAGYHWIFEPPLIPSIYDSTNYQFYEDIQREYWSTQIDLFQLILQSLALLVLFGATFFTVHISEQKKEKSI